VLVEPGIVLIPPPTEAARMGLVPGRASSTSDLEMLCKLGYVTEGCEEFLAPQEDAPEDPEDAGEDAHEGEG
jgi:hypothetical protein